MHVADVDVVRVEGSQLEQLYRLHIDHAFRLAYLLTGNRSIAEDLAQDAFIRVSGRLVRTRDPGEFHAYLRKTVVSVAMSHFRRRRVEQRYLRRQAGYRHEDQAEGDFATREELRLALSSLPLRQRTAIVLRFYEDLSDEQASGLMRCRSATVRSLVSRGLHALRGIIEGGRDE